MEYRQLGSSGVRVSVIGLGTNRFGSPPLPQEEVTRIIDYAQEAGINYIDSANSYVKGQSETTLGRALKGRWDKFFIATKFYNPTGDGTNDQGASRYSMMNACDDSLRRLQTDHIDLYYLHRWDGGTPIEETLRALDDLVRMGKVRYVACSNLAAWQLAHANMLAEMRGWSKFVAIQSEYSLLERDVEKEVLPYCRAQNVGFVPYHPLAGGFLTGKYHRGLPPPPGSRGETAPYMKKYMAGARYYDWVDKLGAWVQARGRSLNELAEAWLLAQPQVCSVISGASRYEQVLDNVKAVGWNLTPADLKEIDTLLA
jgi:aryl-alcohol dehydrogenase-like predicted oxidoreductase